MLATRSRHRRLLVGGLATAVVIAVPFAAGAASSDDQARADAGIAAFGTAATDAGYVDSGVADDDADPLDLNADPETVDSAGQPAGPDACVPDLSSLVDADGTLIGESARSSSNTFDFTDPDATVSTDLFAFADSTTLSAVVYVVDDAHQDSISTLVDLFGSKDLASCLNAALQAADTTTDTTFAQGAFVITNDGDLGLGDQSASLTSSIHFEYNGVSTDINSEVAMARVDRALAVTFSDWSGDTAPDFSAEDALAAVVDAL